MRKGEQGLSEKFRRALSTAGIEIGMYNRFYTSVQKNYRRIKLYYAGAVVRAGVDKQHKLEQALKDEFGHDRYITGYFHEMWGPRGGTSLTIRVKNQ